MFDDYVLYLVESLQSHDRYNELMSSVRGTRQLNNNNNNNNSVSSSTTSRCICHIMSTITYNTQHMT